MEKNLEQLTKDLQSNEALRKTFSEAKLEKGDVDGLIALAAKNGYTITKEDIKALNDRELTPEELEKVAGGSWEDFWCVVIIAAAAGGWNGPIY